MNLEDKDIQCSSVSQLPPTIQSELTSDTLVLVSQPYESTETGYVSRFSRMSDVGNYLSGVYDLGGIHSDIDRIQSDLEGKAEISDLTSAGMITADLDAPYIISALSISFGKVCDIRGYRLSSGMDDEFKRHRFDKISAKDGDYNYLRAYQSKILMTGLSRTSVSDTNLKDTDTLLQVIKKLKKQIDNIESRVLSIENNTGGDLPNITVLEIKEK